MKKICKYCGAQYDGDPGSSCCPDCAASQRKTTLAMRVCRECGKRFPGGPRAWYCPECRAERQREQASAYKRRKAAGQTRKLGSLDICTVCGKPYTVNGGLQKYCPDCAEEAVREIDRRQSSEWNAAHTTPEQRKNERNAASAPIPCAVCGKPFIPTDSSLTCSPECSKQLHSQRHSAWESAHRQERNAYRRQFNTRHIGDTDICVDCGNPYVIQNARQKRCPACSKYLKEDNSND